MSKIEGQGPNSVGNEIYHFYGDYGCNTSLTSPLTPTSVCGNVASDGYTADRIWYMMYGISAAYPLPQVYGTGQGNVVIKLQNYSQTYKGYYMAIRATLTQYAACDSDPTDPTCPGRLQPDAAYDKVNNAVAGDDYIPGETDLRNLPAVAPGGVA